MKYILKNIIKQALPVIICILAIASCNKTLERFSSPIATTQNSLTISDFLISDTNYSLLNALVIRAGLTATLSDKNNTFTLFAPNNAAFRAAGFTTTAIVSGLPVASAAGIAGYLLVPGREYTFADIPTTFPNIQLPTTLSIGVLPGTPVPFKLTIFPSKRGTTVWVNNVAALSFDMHFQNGIVHTISGIVSPPSLLLAQMIYVDPQFTMFDSLIARGDAAQPNPALKIDSALKNPGANLTVFAPTNTAVKAFINAASGGAIPLAAPDAVFFGFIRTSFPATSAQGIVLYHIMGVRAFSVNFPSTATFFPTLLNGGVPTHPGVSVQSFFKTGGLSVDSIKVLGVANGGIPATSKPPSNFDKNAVNGVVHIIDKVLLPF
jgi:uncharacterized surface protein with fasciclin (FAS1) repeats